MKMKLLGRSGVQVSRLCFGTMSFGGDADEAEAARMYAACRDAGINFFDCADVYNAGEAERILGRLIAADRDDLVVASKVFNPMGDDINARGANRRHMVRAVDASLQRLGTDRLDVLFVHMWDDNTPMEETLRGLEDLVRAGKVLYPGVSNWAAWQVAKALGMQAARDFAPLQVIQPMYNLVKRQAEVEILPMAGSEGLGVISYSPLGGGFLTGKYRGAEPGGRLDVNKMYNERYGEERESAVADRFFAFAEEYGFSPVSLAVAWVAGHPDITAPIIGARSLEQLQPSLASAAIEMTPDLRASISALTPAPPPATDRWEER